MVFSILKYILYALFVLCVFSGIFGVGYIFYALFAFYVFVCILWIEIRILCIICIICMILIFVVITYIHVVPYDIIEFRHLLALLVLRCQVKNCIEVNTICINCIVCIFCIIYVYIYIYICIICTSSTKCQQAGMYGVGRRTVVMWPRVQGNLWQRKPNQFQSKITQKNQVDKVRRPFNKSSYFIWLLTIYHI
jgi:hypothetical protein